MQRQTHRPCAAIRIAVRVSMRDVDGQGCITTEIDFGWMAKSGRTPLGFVEAVWLDVAMDGDGSPSTEQL